MSPQPEERIVRIALDVPVNQLFEYRGPGVSTEDIGARVEVPFRSKRAAGVIVELAESSGARELKSVGRIFRDAPRLSDETLKLARFCSDYYHHPLGQVVMMTLPPPMRRKIPALPGPAGYTLTATGAKIEIASIPPRQLVKRKLFAKLRSASWLPTHELRALSPRAAKVLRGMIADAIVAPGIAPKSSAGATACQLNVEQQQALKEIRAAGRAFQPWLLQGVTSSGKTEIYLSLIADTLAAGGQALMLVPEIALTPQLCTRIAARFPDRRVAPLHSGMPGGERLRNWISAQGGTADIVVGTRLAVFTPMPRLRLIIVDEEHDGSFKQNEGLRYSARDLAVYRAKLANCPVILGSATPALESYHRARSGSYRLARLTCRALDASPPEISLIDLSRETPEDGVSKMVWRALASRLAKGEQSLVFINRRGYAPVLWCSSCGHAVMCPRCTANLVLHARRQTLRCHHCGHSEKIPQSCKQCSSAELLPIGHGTQRIEQTLSRHFPHGRILRIDRDSTRAAKWDDILDQIHRKDADILVGTQILAKGHDFPDLTLVTVLDADQALYASDFRASEKLFAQLMQVAGRAGRAKTPGEVLIQTRYPKHPLFGAIKAHDYPAFANALLEERKRAAFPPFVHQALLRAEAPQGKTVFDFLGRAAEYARSRESRVTIYDPVPAQIAKVAGRERGQLLVQCSSRRALQTFLTEWMHKLRGARSTPVRWSLDVDPSEF